MLLRKEGRRKYLFAGKEGGEGREGGRGICTLQWGRRDCGSVPYKGGMDLLWIILCFLICVLVDGKLVTVGTRRKRVKVLTTLN